MNARVKPNWEKPAAPMCEACGVAYDLLAIHMGDGWSLSWDTYCPGCDNELHCDEREGLIGEEAWPFEDDLASDKDWARLGIETEVA